MRIVYFGTPSFAVPTLRRLANDSQFEVVMVVTQPDRPAGRGHRLEESPVAAAARDLGLRYYQPPSLRHVEARAPLVDVAPDIVVVAAYGLIFGPKTLAIPRCGCFNIHASLLPRFRGAAPIPAAILAGDRDTGVTVMQMEAGLDTGPMLGSRREPIHDDDTTGSLTERLAELGAVAAAELLPAYGRGSLTPIAQPAAGASLTRPLSKADGWLDWRRPASDLEIAVRALWPWPRAWTTDGERLLQVHQAAVVPGDPPAMPGTVLTTGDELVVACGEDALRLVRVQAAGGKPLSAQQYLSGRRGEASVLGGSGAPAPQPPLIVPIPPVEEP